MLECDFCSGVDPRWRYPTTPAEHADGPVDRAPQAPDWYACQPCHELIEHDLWTELSARATTLTFAPDWHMTEDHDAWGAAVERRRDDAWARFRAARRGPALRLSRRGLARLLPGAAPGSADHRAPAAPAGRSLARALGRRRP